MEKYRELYEKYPMTTVRITAYLCGAPIIGLILIPIHQLFGKEVYQSMYVPVIAAVVSIYLYFLRKAVTLHIEHSYRWLHQKERFYRIYKIFITVLLVIFSFVAVGYLLGFDGDF